MQTEDFIMQIRIQIALIWHFSEVLDEEEPQLFPIDHHLCGFKLLGPTTLETERHAAAILAHRREILQNNGREWLANCPLYIQKKNTKKHTAH